VADDVATVGSSGSLWRVGRNPEPLTVVAPTAHNLRAKRAGNRFDVPGAGVIYCSSTLEGCFAETLACFRPKLDLAELVADEWKAAGHLRPGSVPAGWRHRRIAVEVSLDPGYRFLDVDHLDTHQVLRGELPWGSQPLATAISTPAPSADQTAASPASSPAGPTSRWRTETTSCTAAPASGTCRG